MTEPRPYPEVHVAGFAMRRSFGIPQILFCRRAESRRYFPGQWDGCGGRLQPGLSFETAIWHHFHDEFGLYVRPLEHVVLYSFEGDGGVVPGVRFLCKLHPVGPQEPLLNPERHTEYRWVDRNNIVQFYKENEFIPGICAAARELLALNGPMS